MRRHLYLLPPSASLRDRENVLQSRGDVEYGKVRQIWSLLLGAAQVERETEIDQASNVLRPQTDASLPRRQGRKNHFRDPNDDHARLLNRVHGDLISLRHVQYEG